MREIKFRAKPIEMEDWVYGFGVMTVEYVDGSFSYHLYSNGGDYVVDPETVGQYPEIKDKNGVEIFEGDIVIREIFARGAYNEDFIGEVKMYEGRWWIDNGNDAVPLWTEIEELSILGNIYQNPELLNSQSYKSQA